VLPSPSHIAACILLNFSIKLCFDEQPNDRSRFNSYHKSIAIMGGWDSYCAICGSTFRSDLSIDSDDETDLTYSGEVIGESDLQWLQTLRAIGLNAESCEERKSVISIFLITKPRAYPLSTDLSSLAQAFMMTM
jgi:hypothetical protein